MILSSSVASCAYHQLRLETAQKGKECGTSLCVRSFRSYSGSSIPASAIPRTPIFVYLYINVGTDGEVGDTLPGQTFLSKND